MTCQLNHVLGREQDFFVTPQTSLALVNAAAGPPTNVAGGALQILSSQFSFSQAQEPRRDARGGRDDYEMIPGRIEGSFTIEAHMVPPTALTNRPDAHHLLNASFGAHTFNSGTSTVYNLTNSGLCLPLSLWRRMNRNAPRFMEAARFAIVDEFKASGNGGEPPKLTWSGRFAQHIGTSNSAITTGAATALQNVTAGTGTGFEIGSLVQIGAQTNGGAGFPVTAVAANTITVNPAPTLTVTGDLVIPFAPAPTLSTQPVLGHTVGSLSYAGAAIPVTEWELSIKQNYEFVEDEFGQLYITDAIPSFRDNMFSFKTRAREDLVRNVVQRKGLSNVALTIVCGLGAGRLWTFSAPQVRPDVEGIDLSGVSVGAIPIKGRCLASAQNALDALSLTAA